ncbi:TPA: dimethyl sulfoxide reductase anchor subunit [Klebsiella pneumoniae]|uniref:DmsC/YnfH family molybdoenzyme membrane anchor subunit n=1 Tax=Klebsiella pneumoniae TaxID=573 RepID=UPI0013EF278F|nr:dimethyl sulfoxide reductase anchor subunit [Klebsiella pneumoniae]
MSNQESPGGVSRRALLKSTALGSLALAAGGLTLPFTLRRAAAAVQQATGDTTRIVWGACSVNCGSRCALLLRLAKVDFNGWFFAGLSVAALVISAAVIIMQSAGLSTLHSSVQQAATLLPDYGKLQALRLVLLALGLGCWLCPLIRRQPPRATGLLIGLLLVLIAECIGRGLFYGLHMTVGMAVAG